MRIPNPGVRERNKVMATYQAEPSFTASPEQLLNVIKAFIEPRTPSVPIPPPQRIERFVRLALRQVFGPSPDPWLTAQRYADFSTLASPGDRVALNPQPLPPRYQFLTALAQEVINTAELMLEINAAASEGNERGVIVIGGYVESIVDDTCGNGFRLIWRGPGPRPNWFPDQLSGIDLLVMGNQFAESAHNQFNPDLGEVMSAAAAKLAKVGASRLQDQ
jgi:hypothetical protein